MSNENENGQKPQDENGEKEEPRWKNWGAKTRFGSGNPQPAPEAKKAGWERRRRNQALIRMMLAVNYIERDPGYKALLSKFTNVPVEELDKLSAEELIILRQIGKAIQDGDNDSARFIMERAYGKPKEHVTIDDERGGGPPVFNITVVTPNADGTIPEIDEEYTDEQTNLLGNEDGTPTT